MTTLTRTLSAAALAAALLVVPVSADAKPKPDSLTAKSCAAEGGTFTTTGKGNKATKTCTIVYNDSFTGGYYDEYGPRTTDDSGVTSYYSSYVTGVFNSVVTRTLTQTGTGPIIETTDGYYYQTGVEVAKYCSLTTYPPEGPSSSQDVDNSICEELGLFH